MHTHVSSTFDNSVTLASVRAEGLSSILCTTKFDVDSFSLLSFRGQTNSQTDTDTKSKTPFISDHPTRSATTVSVGNNSSVYYRQDT